jgi:CheY-like chemotaxis protein
MHIIRFTRFIKYAAPRLARFHLRTIQRIRQNRSLIKQLVQRLAELELEKNTAKAFHVENTLLRFNLRPHLARHRVQVLIIEDNVEYMTQFKQACRTATELAQRPVTITAIDDLNEAFALIETDYFDVVLSDMEVINGKMDTVLVALKQHIKAKVLMVSNYPESAFKGRKPSFYDAWLSKSFSPEQLAPYLKHQSEN